MLMRTHSQCHYDYCCESKRVLSFSLYIFNSFFQAFLSDGTLGWRFYVVFNKEKWALYLPTASVIINAREFAYQVVCRGTAHGFQNVVLCLSADGQHLAIYFNEEFYKKTLLPVILKITVAWGWSMFFTNSLMTGGIIYKIM